MTSAGRIVLRRPAGPRRPRGRVRTILVAMIVTFLLFDAIFKDVTWAPLLGAGIAIWARWLVGSVRAAIAARAAGDLRLQLASCPICGLQILVGPDAAGAPIEAWHRCPVPFRRELI